MPGPNSCVGFIASAKTMCQAIDRKYITLVLYIVVSIVTTQLSRQIARHAITHRASAAPNSNQCLTAGAVDSCTAGNGATSAGSGSGSGLRSSAISST